jgi:hypothetical protein
MRNFISYFNGYGLLVPTKVNFQVFPSIEMHKLTAMSPLLRRTQQCGSTFKTFPIQKRAISFNRILFQDQQSSSSDQGAPKPSKRYSGV